MTEPKYYVVFGGALVGNGDRPIPPTEFPPATVRLPDLYGDGPGPAVGVGLSLLHGTPDEIIDQVVRGLRTVFAAAPALYGEDPAQPSTQEQSQPC